MRSPINDGQSPRSAFADGSRSPRHALNAIAANANRKSEPGKNAAETPAARPRRATARPRLQPGGRIQPLSRNMSWRTNGQAAPNTRADRSPC
jgi:hypothetical protein